MSKFRYFQLRGLIYPSSKYLYVYNHVLLIESLHSFNSQKYLRYTHHQTCCLHIQSIYIVLNFDFYK